MTYLELCKELVKLLGIAGGTGPTTVANQVGEIANVVTWIRNADLNIQNAWEDWRFLWVRYSEQLPQGSAVFPAPQIPVGVTVRRWETDTLKIRSLAPLAPRFQDLTYLPRPQFEAGYDPDVEDAGTPQVYTVLPDNSIQLDRPADTLYALKGGFFRSPVALELDSEVSAIPVEYHRIIVVRAAIMYGDKEDAPEVINGAEAEYLELLDKLEGSQLEAFRYRRSSRQEQRTGAVVEPRWA